LKIEDLWIPLTAALAIGEYSGVGSLCHFYNGINKIK